MKYAFMSFSCPDATVDQMLAMATRYGYDGIEPRIDENHRHGIEVAAASKERADVRRRVRDSGIAVCCIATGCVFANPATAGANADHVRHCIDLAADVGCNRLRVFGGKIPAGLGREQALRVAAEALGSVADHAAARNVTVCVETHDDWCDPHHVADLMRHVNHPAIAVNWDIMHPVRAGNSTMQQAFDVLRPWIGHVHFHDGLTRLDALEMCPIGRGEIDHAAAVRLLMNMPYDGYLSGEWIGWEPAEVHLPRELAAIRSLER